MIVPRQVGVLLAALLFPGAASAYCAPEIDTSAKAEFARSAYVATVRVVSTTWLDENRRPARLRGPLMLGSIPGGFDPYSGANYKVEVLRLFKGRPSAFLTIFSENTEAWTPLKNGSRYLVFR